MAAAFPITKAFQWDLARQVERLDFLLSWLPRYAEWGYQELYLHLEDAVVYPSLPGVARRDAYSRQQFTRLVDAATKVGIGVVPIVNLLGHTQYLIKHPRLRDLNELRAPDGSPLERGQICPLHPRTPEIAEKLLRDMAPFCTTGKVHVGLDESFHLGRCPRCRAEVRRRGVAAHFAGHVQRLHQVCGGLGLQMGLWADMLALLPAAIPLLPRDVIAYDWYYHPFGRHPRVELHNFAEVDLAAPLQARGIEYWGCPMNGAFRYEPLPVFGERMANIVSWWRRCRRVGAGGFLVTSWEANRLAIELTIAIDAAAACLWLEPDLDNLYEMLQRGFERVFGGTPVRSCGAASSAVATRLWRGRPNAAVNGNVQALSGVRPALRSLGEGGRPRPTTAAECRQMSRTAHACDNYPFSGYHRWQINDRWDVCAGRDGAVPYQREERLFHRVQARSYKERWPTPLASSVVFRRYLAQRDVFVRRNAATVFRLRRLLAAAVGRGRRTPPLAGLGGSRPFQRAVGQLQRDTAAFAKDLRTGRSAARAMWNRSRDPQVRGPNELMLAADARRLREWQLWLRRAARHPEIIWHATPVCGAWQLQFTVHNFAPALQRLVVEQRQPDGSWRTLHGLPLIEFRAFAARPRTRIKHEFSVPVAAPQNTVGRVDLPAEASGEGRVPNAPLASPKPGGGGRRVGDNPPYPPTAIPLRVAVRGVGQIAISHIELTNGVIRLHPRGWPPAHKTTLGRPAPRRGLPTVDFEKNTGAVAVRFAGLGPSRRLHG
jgi:hypothetical protein